MATKAELEAEVAELRRQLADRTEQKAAPVASAEPEASDEADEPTDWEKEIGDVLNALEEFPHKQPLLLALGAFAVGFLLGRSK